MGFRLSKIYTRTGDAGTTGLGDGSRTRKDSLRINALGELDELNCTVGVLATEIREASLPTELLELLATVQHDLFNLGGEICIPGMAMIQDSDIQALEDALDEMNEHLAPLQEFILPGGTRAASAAHLARAVCRRAERALVALAAEEEVNPPPMKYVNRLSDLLFVMGRRLNQLGGHTDVLWKRKTEKVRKPGKEAVEESSE